MNFIYGGCCWFMHLHKMFLNIFSCNADSTAFKATATKVHLNTIFTKKKYIYTVGKKLFDPLLILYVCPLTKKLSVYHFNGRFIWTVRDRITKQKKSRKTFKKSYKLICILMSQISIWPLRKTWLSTWWQNPCWQSQRSDVSCSWPPGLHTSQEGFCPTPLCRSSPSH